MKEKNEEEKLVPIIVRVSKAKKEMIEELANKQGRFEADIIRSGIDKELDLEMNKSNLDSIMKEIDIMLDKKLEPFISNQRRINAQYLRTNAVNTYLQGEVFSRLFGDDLHKQFMNMLSNARKKANYYISRDTEGMTSEDLYDFYTIGEIYRNE